MAVLQKNRNSRDWQSRSATATALIATLALAAWAGPALAASFDCAKAGTAVEKVICGDAELSKLDDALGIAYAQARKRGADATAVESGQAAWLRDVRNACADAACLKGAYEARIALLAGAGAATGMGKAVDARSEAVKWAQLFEVGRPAGMFSLIENGNPELCEPLLKSLNRPWPSDARWYPFILLRNDYLVRPWHERVLTWRLPGGAMGSRHVDAAFIDIDGDGIEDGVFREHSALSGRDFQYLMLVLSVEPAIREEEPISEAHARDITAHYVHLGRAGTDPADPDPRHFVELVRLHGRYFILTSRAYFWTLEGRPRYAKIELFQVDEGIERICLFQAVREISDYRQ